MKEKFPSKSHKEIREDIKKIWDQLPQEKKDEFYDGKKERPKKPNEVKENSMQEKKL